MPTVTVIQPTIAEEKAVKIRCAAYCRVSSDSEDQLNSFMAQTRYYSQILRIRKQKNSSTYMPTRVSQEPVRTSEASFSGL